MIKDTTSEDYLDSLLNSIMNNDTTDSDSDINSDDLGLFGDSKDKFDDVLDLEDELFGGFDDTDVELIDDDDDFFEKEISTAELFDLDDDILSVVNNIPDVKEKTAENMPESPVEYNEEPENEKVKEEPQVAEEDAVKIHEVIKDDDIEEAIAVNDSAADDDLQGLLDVMGIEDNSQDVAIDLPKKKKKEKKEKKKLFGKKKKDKEVQSENDVDEEAPVNEDMLDLSSLSDMFSGATEEVHSLDFSSMDLLSNDEENEEKPVDDDLMSMGLNDLDDFNLDMSSNNNASSPKDDFDFDLDADDEDLDNDDSDKKSKKGKKEKKKKVKKEKSKKVKPAKKKKEKEKRVKQPDEIIKISKHFIIFWFSIAFILIFSVVFGGDYYIYNKKMSKATKEFVDKNYTVAYDTLFGVKMKKDDDQELFNQIQTVMFVNRHYEAYESLIKMDEYEQGLYSLLKGVKMFDKYQNDGRDLNCYDDMQTVLGWIDRGLMETYGLTESQARELNFIKNDDKLAYEVCVIAQEAREKAEAEAKALEEAEKLEKENEDKE